MSFPKPSHGVQVLLAVLIAGVGIPAVLWLVMSGSLHGTRSAPVSVGASTPAQFIGSAGCRECHEAEFNAWRGSHHDLAMQPADESTVLGDFGDVTFEHRGVTTRFFRRGGAFMVETQGADGDWHEYEVGYTFGVTPLQQYLIGFPDGRYQALTVAWDSRPAAQGGQRWFHLYPNEDIPPGDELHWTAPAHNWNFACAECHSTDLRKNYDLAADTYATTWSEINVGCESCHGPGSRHAEIANAAAEGEGNAYSADQGLVVQLRKPGQWRREAGASVAALVQVPRGASEVESCARCHSRRTELTDNYEYGKPLSETHRVQLLNDPYYFPDGQIRDEVYVYASFRQSRMYDMGVTCGDCHDPHSLKLRTTGNAMCTTCHAPEVYDVVEHHYHEMGTDGAQCVECHMPTRTYMVVDPRLDHSMRVPRPDLSVALGVPNACNQCHTDESPEWAARAIVDWYGDLRKPGFQTYAPALQAARDGAAGAGDRLAALAMDEAVPTIARATALSEMTPYLDGSTLPAIKAGLGAPDPLMRRAAVEALEGVDVAIRSEILTPLLRDPVRSVRIAAASALSDIVPGTLEGVEREALQDGFDEYVESERFNADRAEHWVNLAGFHFRQGDAPQAERDYAEAARRNPRFTPIYANQADMYRALGRDADGERVLLAGLGVLPESATLHHSLGLLYVRTGRTSEAMSELATAYRLAPESARFGYVYGIGLDSIGQTDRAIGVWEDVFARFPNDQNVVQSLAVTLARAGDAERALPYAERLLALVPGDPGVAQFVEALRRELARSR